MTDQITLQLKQFIKVKRQKVFDAWTKPELMKQWYAPGPMKVPDAKSDLKLGGSYMVEMKGEMGGEIVNPTVKGVYQKIIPNELICFTWQWQNEGAAETLVTVEFKDADGGTEVILTHERFTNSEARDKHQHGWQGCLAKLDMFLK